MSPGTRLENDGFLEALREHNQWTETDMNDTVGTHTVFSGKVIQLRKSLYGSRTEVPRSENLVVRPDTIGILPVCQDGRLLFIEEYALGAGKPLLTLPGGKVEGRAGHSLIDEAQRELREENWLPSECNG
jgi:ADP-ribose pyrophosphatase